MRVLLATAYWPNLHYFYYVLNGDEIMVENHEHYQKQSFRNRTQLLSANGVLDLNIPVGKKKDKELVSQVEISYTERWQIKHWRAITSAYRNSPYFEYFEDDIRQFYDTKYELLFDYNLQQLKTIFRILKLKKEILVTLDYEKDPAGLLDLRALIHPKKDPGEDKKVGPLLSRPYYQTFGNKFGFTCNLSILDLLFNTGLDTLNYFPKDTLTL